MIDLSIRNAARIEFGAAMNLDRGSSMSLSSREITIYGPEGEEVLNLLVWSQEGETIEVNLE